MANEILKDEIMSEEELDNVAGGTAAEMAKDTAFFHAVGLMSKSYSADYCAANTDEVAAEIDRAAYLVLRGNHNLYLVNSSSTSANTYVYHSNGEDDVVYTREEFYAQVCRVLGKSDFDYKKYL